MTAVPVVFVSSHAKERGSERYLEILLQGLGPAWISDVVCLEGGPFVRRLQAMRLEPRVIHTTRHWPGILRSAWSLRRLLLRRGVRVVHANGVKAALVGALAVVGTGTRLVWVKHDFAWDGVLTRAVGRAASRIIGVSEAVVADLRPRLSAKIRVVHNAVPEMALDRSAERNRLLSLVGASADAKLVALVGSLHPVYGHLEMLAVAPRLIERLPTTRLIFVGGDDPSTGAYGSEVRTRVRELQLERAVAFLGHREDAVSLIAGSDVLAIPSVPWGRSRKGAGFPFVALEGLALGTPIVAYSEGGIPELLGPCGMLVRRGDRDALLEATVRVIEDEGLRHRVARCGIGRSRALFSPARVVGAMADEYLRVAG